jgi:uncharacterized RmlC-like cupin family protein
MEQGRYPMARAGQAFENPVTGERMVFNATAHKTNGTVLAIEFFVQPNVGRGLAAHFHPYFSERVEIITGVAHYKVGQDELAAKAGDVVILPRHVPHIHPWNVGNGVLHWRKTTQLDKPEMQLLVASAAFFESLYALAQQGRVGANGLPKNPLQTIVLLQALQPSAYVAGLPIWLQRPLFGTLATIGQALGCKAYYPAVSTSFEQDQDLHLGKDEYVHLPREDSTHYWCVVGDRRGIRSHTSRACNERRAGGTL